jgi:Holliday junction resolvase RusA-like endonuclease
MNISVITDNCDQERSFLIECSANSEVELRMEFDQIVSVQSRNERKTELCIAIQEELSKFQWNAAGSVNVEFLWYLHGTERQETDKLGDIDNITKPVLDALTGSKGVLIDDSQIGSLHTFWQSRNEMTTFNALYLRISINNDCCIRKQNLYFVQYAGAICAPMNINFNEPKEILGALVVIKARLRHRATAQKIKLREGNVDRILVNSDWDIHRTRLNGFDRASIISIEDLKKKCCEHGFTWRLLRSMWRYTRGEHA